LKVNLISDSFFSQFYLSERNGKFRLTVYAERGSIVLTLDRQDLEAIEKLIADTLRPIPVVTDRLADELLGQVRT
jgi:hypothetical protein